MSWWDVKQYSTINCSYAIVLNWTNFSRFIPQRHEILGPDLATAHFVVARGGCVKFVGMERWIQKDSDGKYNLPKHHTQNMFVEGIDCTESHTMYDSFDNFSKYSPLYNLILLHTMLISWVFFPVNLKHLKYLNLANCVNVDDWCLDRFQMFANTLVYLDLSGCPVTERGLACLHRLKYV